MATPEPIPYGKKFSIYEAQEWERNHNDKRQTGETYHWVDAETGEPTVFTY